MSLKLSFFYRFASIRSLSFIALAILGLPLLLSLTVSIFQVQQLAERGQGLMFSLADSISHAEELEHQVKELERLAKQALILDQPSAFQRYQQQQLKVMAFVAEHIDADALLLADLSHLDKLMAEQTIERDQLNLQMDKLYLFTQDVQQQTWDNLDRQALLFRQFSQDALQSIWMSLAMLPLAVIVAIVMLWGITAPLKRLRLYIQGWQKDNLTEAIHINGVREVVVIAEALEQMRQRTAYLESQKRQFLRHLSHELKTPLAAIREGNSLLYDNSLGTLNVQQQEICQILKDSSLRLQLLIENLLDFNLVLTQNPKRRQVSLAQLSDKVLAHHQLSLKTRQLKLNLQFEPVDVHSSPEQLRVIIDNLISNAIKFAPQGSELRLGSESIPGKGLCWYVDDQGEGLDSLAEDDIFHAFVQGHKAGNSSIKGSGLGLTIAKELADLLGLELSHQRLQQRTRFIIAGLQGEQNDH